MILVTSNTKVTEGLRKIRIQAKDTVTDLVNIDAVFELKILPAN
jgi:hypothetical protein